MAMTPSSPYVSLPLLPRSVSSSDVRSPCLRIQSLESRRQESQVLGRIKAIVSDMKHKEAVRNRPRQRKAPLAQMKRKLMKSSN